MNAVTAWPGKMTRDRRSARAGAFVDGGSVLLPNIFPRPQRWPAWATPKDYRFMSRHHRGKPAPILADVSEFIDVLDPARGLEHQGFEARRDRGCEFDAQRFGPGDQLLRIGNVGRRDLVHHFAGRVAKHPLGADVEDLYDALGVGGDAREIGAVENGALQGARLEQHLFRLVARDVVGAHGDADLRPCFVAFNSDGLSPGDLNPSRLANRLRDFKMTLQAVVQLNVGVAIAYTASEGSVRRQQTDQQTC